MNPTDMYDIEIYGLRDDGRPVTFQSIGDDDQEVLAEIREYANLDGLLCAIRRWLYQLPEEDDDACQPTIRIWERIGRSRGRQVFWGDLKPISH